MVHGWLAWRAMRGPTSQLSRGWRRHGGLLPARNPDGIVFAACDRRYFERYADEFVRSVLENSGRLSVHLHVYDAPDELLAESTSPTARYPAARVTISRDEEADRSLYSPFLFAAGRFVRLAELLASTASPIVCTDVDVVVRGDLQPFVAAMSGRDVGLYFRLHNASPWRKILASTVVAMPTPQAGRFLGRLARAMDLALLRCPRHHVDQLMLYYAYRMTRLGLLGPIRYARLPQSVIDWELHEDSLIWNLKGSRRKPAYYQRGDRKAS